MTYREAPKMTMGLTDSSSSSRPPSPDSPPWSPVGADVPEIEFNEDDEGGIALNESSRRSSALPSPAPAGAEAAPEMEFSDEDADALEKEKEEDANDEEDDLRPLDDVQAMALDSPYETSRRSSALPSPAPADAEAAPEMVFSDEDADALEQEHDEDEEEQEEEEDGRHPLDDVEAMGLDSPYETSHRSTPIPSTNQMDGVAVKSVAQLDLSDADEVESFILTDLDDMDLVFSDADRRSSRASPFVAAASVLDMYFGDYEDDPSHSLAAYDGLDQEESVLSELEKCGTKLTALRLQFLHRA